MTILKVTLYFILFFSPAILLYLSLTQQDFIHPKKQKDSKVYLTATENPKKSFDFENNIPQSDSSSNLELNTDLSLSNLNSSLSIDSSVLDNFSGENLSYKSVSSSGTLTELEPLYKSEPSYPQTALMRNIEGWVKLKIDIKADGSVTNVRIIQSYPPRTFNRSAKRAVSSWKYAKSTNGKKDHIVELKYILN